MGQCSSQNLCDISKYNQNESILIINGAPEYKVNCLQLRLIFGKTKQYFTSVLLGSSKSFLSFWLTWEIPQQFLKCVLSCYCHMCVAVQPLRKPRCFCCSRCVSNSWPLAWPPQLFIPLNLGSGGLLTSKRLWFEVGQDRDQFIFAL